MFSIISNHHQFMLKTEHFVADNSSVEKAIKYGAEFHTSALFGQQTNFERVPL
jgi:hypothetical protein